MGRGVHRPAPVRCGHDGVATDGAHWRHDRADQRAGHPSEELGVEVDQYPTHIYRRTTATLVERAAGLTLASRLLSHANEQITRTSYVVSAEEVDPITVDVLDGLLGN